MTEIHATTTHELTVLDFEKFEATGNTFGWGGKDQHVRVHVITVTATQNGPTWKVDVVLRGQNVLKSGELGRGSASILTHGLSKLPEDLRRTVAREMNTRAPLFREDGTTAKSEEERRHISIRTAADMMNAQYNRPEVKARLAELGIGGITVDAD